MKRRELKKRDAGVLNEATLFLSAGAIRRRRKKSTSSLLLISSRKCVFLSCYQGIFKVVRNKT